MENENGFAARPDEESDREEIVFAEPHTPEPSGLGRALILLAVLLGSPLLTLYAFMLADFQGSSDAMWTQIEILPQMAQGLGGSYYQEGSNYEQPDMETELGWLRSSELIDSVVRERNLVKVQNFRTEDEAGDWLRNRLIVRHAGGRLVDIGFQMPGGHMPEDPKLAEQLVTDVAQGYRQMREEISRDHMQMMLDSLNLEAKAAEAYTERAWARMQD